MKTITLKEFNSLSEEDFRKMLVDNGCFIAPIRKDFWMIHPPKTDFTLDSKTFKYAWNFFYGSLIKF
jgi:hypothetical protein